ncbi:MAG: protein arginine kinase [Verrucomicrobia bacterium]|nr:protein arginine kinase [Verrucomicrobiota bacterium]
MTKVALQEFLTPPAEMARRRGPQDEIVLSSRVRLARNLEGCPFPGTAKKEQRQKVLGTMLPAVESLKLMQNGFSTAMDALTALDKTILVERHLISREHAARNVGSGLVLNKDESVCVMINEEDHLRMQALLPGFQIKQAWKLIDGVDTELEKSLDYAFSPVFGFLTACPTNLGTAIRVSAMLHLPGLVLSEQIEPIIQSVNKLGLAVRGLYGEGTEALGNIFQVSNQMTLGEAETSIAERLEKVVKQIIEHEENARGTLLERSPKTVYNHIGRAYGVLSNAHSISSKESMNLLSFLRLGLELGHFPGVDRSVVDELFVQTQPAHLQRMHTGRLSGEERDLLRADMLRQQLRNMSRPVMQAPPGQADDSAEKTN